MLWLEEEGVVDVVPLRAAIAQSRLIGASQLTGPFTATRGFGLACHLDALDEALRRVPWLAPFAHAAVDEDRLRRLHPQAWWERAGSFFFGDINALYLNVLVVPPGGAVERHIDSTLGTAGPDDPVVVPRAVAVVYVDVPAGLVGGELALYEGDTLRATITPQAGRFVLFRGDLGHEVRATAPSTSSARVSCVCEVYALPRARLAKLPRVRLQSHGFAEVLDRLKG